MDETRKHIVTDKVSKGPVTQSMIEKYGSAGPPPNPSSGMASNAGTKAPAATDKKTDDGYENRVEKTEPTRTQTTTDTKPAVGSVKSMVINVAADNKETAFGDATKLASLKSFVENEVDGKDKLKFIAKVTPMAFDDTTKTQIVKAQEESKGAAKMQQLFSLLPIAALLIVGVMVVKQLGKLTKPSFGTMVAANGQLMQVPMGSGSGHMTYAVDGTPDLSNPQNAEAYKRAISKYTDEELAEMGEDGIIYRDNDEILEVEKIREKKSVHLSAIKQMAKDRPEPTAMLIKTWLTEPTPK